MKLNSGIALASLIMVALSSCREIYNPDDLESTRDIPVIEGRMTENGIATARITWASPYLERNIRYIQHAMVWIEDDLGRITYLWESEGKYYSENNVGEKGREYTLHVSLPDGSLYESAPTMIRDNLGWEDRLLMYAAPGVNTLFSNSGTSGVVSKTQKGLFVMADVMINDTCPSYFRFSTRVIKEKYYIKYPDSKQATEAFAWETLAPGSFFNSNCTEQGTTGYFLKRHHIYFLPYDPGHGPVTVIKTPDLIIGWVVILKVYSIAREAYEYYNSINLQLESDDQIFSPPPARVKSMMHCTSDSVRPVVGVFEASSVKEYIYAFSWTDMRRYLSKELEYFPDIEPSGESLYFKPYWWVVLP